MNGESPGFRRSALAIEDGVARFEMRDPASRNALTAELKADYIDLVGLIGQDKSIRALVISGAEGAFCAGGDLKALMASNGPDGAPIRDVEAARTRMRHSHQWFQQLFNLEVPVIAAVDGPAFGAGFSLALAADFILATPRATFCMSFNRIGAIPDLAALYMLPRMIGLRRAKELMMTARPVSAEEALSLGIVHGIHAQQALMQQAMAMARNFAQGSAESLAFTKLYANQSMESDYTTMARLEGMSQATCLTSDYFFDAVNRFVERKPARFVWDPASHVRD